MGGSANKPEGGWHARHAHAHQRPNPAHSLARTNSTDDLLAGGEFKFCTRVPVLRLLRQLFEMKVDRCEKNSSEQNEFSVRTFTMHASLNYEHISSKKWTFFFEISLSGSCCSGWQTTVPSTDSSGASSWRGRSLNLLILAKFMTSRPHCRIGIPTISVPESARFCTMGANDATTGNSAS